jgi:molybdate transport system regulatory protein
MFIRALRYEKGGDMDVKFKVWVEKKGEVVLSNGKLNILKTIDQLGSIHKAAEQFGMSYRHAWGMVQKIEKRSGVKMLETQIGGSDGGGANLTTEGKAFLAKYEAFSKGLDKLIENKFSKAFSKG